MSAPHSHTANELLALQLLNAANRADDERPECYSVPTDLLRDAAEALTSLPSDIKTPDQQSLPQSKEEWKGPYVQPNCSGELPSAPCVERAPFDPVKFYREFPAGGNTDRGDWLRRCLTAMIAAASAVPAAQPTLICPRCKVDRYKAACPEMRSQLCPMVGDARGPE